MSEAARIARARDVLARLIARRGLISGPAALIAAAIWPPRRPGRRLG